MIVFIKKNLFFLIILLMVACHAKKQGGLVGPRQQGPILAEGFLVQPQNVSENVEVPGTLLPQEETQIRAEVSGRVTSLDIAEGTVVP